MQRIRGVFLGVVVLVALMVPRTAQASVSVTILSSSEYSSNSFRHIVGEVQNTGTEIVRFVRIDLQYYDSSNVLLDTDFTYSNVETLAPGERSGFHNIFEPPPGYHRYTASVTASATTSPPNHNFTTRVTNVFSDSSGYQHIVGQVTNDNTTRSEFVQVNFTFYDGSGRTVDVDFTYVDSDDRASLPAGGTDSFEIMRAPSDPAFASYTVLADSPTAPSAAGGPPPSAPGGTTGSGYWMLSRAGSVYAFGDAGHFGSLSSSTAEDIEPTADGGGYWIVDSAGHVFTFGNAPYLGGVNGGLQPGEIVTSLSPTRSGGGYWLFSTLGRVFAFGDAVHHGSMAGTRLNGPVLDSIPTASGNGYYMVASDGGIFAFGDARFFGSMGGHRLNQPVMSLVPDADNIGYWLVASDGGVFAFDAPFRGSMGATKLNKPVVGMVRFGNGYLMVGADGGIFNFSNRPFHGSLGSNPPASPIVAVAVNE